MIYSFEWDDDKDLLNRKRHGVSFVDAQEAFYDEDRIIISDEAHSVSEERLFCIGKTPKGVLTVRFTVRGSKIRIIGAGKWRKGENSMKKSDKLEAMPIGKIKIIKDFLPPPSHLVRRTETVRVTSEFSRSSIDFLKKEARKAKVPYQRMLRSLVDLYVERHSEN